MTSTYLYKQEKFIHQKLNRNKTNEYTKMVNAISKRRKSVKDENDPVRQRMLKERQDHARRQDQDYSHVFRRKTRFELIRLSLIIMGIEFAYSAETAFVSPILLSIGIEHKHMTLVWALSPFLGFFLSPILGSISDRCSSRFGRRRPVIFTLSLGIILGLFLAPYGRLLGEFVGGWEDDDDITIITNNTVNSNLTNVQYETNAPLSGSSFYWALCFTVLGTIMLDFSADNCQTPSRAYLLDVCLSEEHGKALSTFTIMAGIGGCLGYALGAVDWNGTIFANLIGDNIKTVFALVTVIFILCSLTTISSFREIPLKLLESDEMLRPLTQITVKKEKERLKAMENGKQQIQQIPVTAMVVTEKLKPNGVTNGAVNSYTEVIVKSSSSSISSSDDDDDDEDSSVTFMMYLKSIIFMPKSLRILCITNCLAWMGHIVYCLYFTDFVGEAVFGGDPSADPESHEYQLYDQGIRFGCMGMAVYAFACALYSMIIEKLIKKFSAKYVYVGGLSLFGLAMAFLGKFPTKIGVIAFSTTAGVVYATLFTIPFMLVAQYHSKQTFKVRNPDSEIAEKAESTEVFERGLGTDCGIVGSMLFVAQFTMSLSIGSFITFIDSTAAVLYAASFFSFLAAISACFVVYMDL
ncbi:membrane-associated transporter protein-like isoform X2 [Chironomus tepperi]|uniref:membrane-associated transporter protein-like isoform X2 n=1 Tax=Chironomus tepperi TaxID=113505 RepID=UPI00391F5C9B